MQIKKPCALTELPAGCRARVSRIEGASDARARLSALGFTPDTAIEVLDCCGGRQVVKVRGCNLILDDNTAGMITCAKDDDSAPCACGRRRFGFLRHGKGRARNR